MGEIWDGISVSVAFCPSLPGVSSSFFVSGGGGGGGCFRSRGLKLWVLSFIVGAISKAPSLDWTLGSHNGRYVLYLNGVAGLGCERLGLVGIDGGAR
ncbi:hypothetical protein NL676_004430 [Syzygium grande]|nr:hypothetical protein NL676_004430 [Syzygium grande]